MIGKRALQIYHIGLAALLAVILSACGGGGSGDGGATASISGTAAIGAPLDGFIYVTDRNGVEVNVPINADGSFSVPVGGMTPPFMLRAVPNAGGDTLYSYANTADITVNVTPLTNLSLFLANNQNDLATLYNTWASNMGQFSESDVRDAQEIINANLLAELNAAGVDPTLYDFLHTPFDADSTGIDAVLDGLVITVDGNANSFTVTDANLTVLGFDVNVDTSAIDIPSLNGLNVSDASTWALTITDSANQIPPTTITIPGVQVPEDEIAFRNFSEADFSGSFTSQDVTITFDMSTVGFTFNGAGEVGTTITGRIAGTVSVVGTVNGQVVNETVTFDTTFAWERIS